jgi:type I restriction enzyme S subunit
MSSSDQVRTYSRSESVVFLKTDEPFGGLSNMAGGYPIRVNGIRILTSEALYQACRFPHLPDVQRMIIGENSPMTAKMRSKPYRKDSRRDWDHVRVRIMRWCLRMKLASNWSAFSELLLRTGDRPIVEQSRKDDFWGAKVVGDGNTLVGMNVLGRLLMELREQVKEHGRDAFLRVELPGIPDFQLLGRPIEIWALKAAQLGAAVLATSQAGLFGDDLPMESSAPTAPTSVTAASQTAEHSSMPAPLLIEADVALAEEASPTVVSEGAPAYPSYRAARMRWLPPVPEHWNEQRAKTYFREVDERSRTGEEELLSVSHLTGVTPRSQKNVTMFKAASYVGHKVCRPGDIVVNTLWAWMAALGAARHTGLVSPAYGIYRPRKPDGFNPGYLDYLLRTRAYVAEYIGRSTGIRASRLRLYPNQFLDIPLLRPPRAEQDQIVAYLRAQDVHVARFIKAKRDLLALMAEQRAVLAERAIASADTNPIRLDRVVRLVMEPITRESGATYTPIGMFNRGRGIFHKPATEGQYLGDSTFFRIVEGDLIFSGQFAWEGAIAVVGAIDDGCIASHRYPIAKCMRDVVTPEYLYTFFLSKAGDLLLNHHSRGAAGRNRPLNPRSLLKEKIPVPPLCLQREITEFFREEQSVRVEIEKEIGLIREYRDRLIADVVTGQIDVRGWMPGPDDVASEDELAALGDDEAGNAEEEEVDGHN